MSGEAAAARRTIFFECSSVRRNGVADAEHESRARDASKTCITPALGALTAQPEVAQSSRPPANYHQLLTSFPTSVARSPKVSMVCLIGPVTGSLFLMVPTMAVAGDVAATATPTEAAG
jgi:hypothetical protein